MLISMPTGTSTIFGVFQAILALLVNRTKFALPDKLVQIEKFASEIFCHRPRWFMLQRKRNSLLRAALMPNRRWINTFRVAGTDPAAGSGSMRGYRFRIKNA
jgi:hypothetical protein